MALDTHTKSENTRRLAKNTMMLYVRTLVIMFVSLYTVRIIFKALGAEDYGIHNVVSGFVTMFSFVTGSLSVSISRTMSIELGKKGNDNISSILSVSLYIMTVLSILLAIIVELIGLYFLNTEMNIPNERLLAANWVLHFSSIVLIVNMLSIPFEALIVSYEKMSIYAYISIIDGALKLFIAYLLLISSGDKLILYSFLLLIEAVIIRIVYSLYCTKILCVKKISWNKDKSKLKEILYLSGWDLWGSSSYILKNYGVNIVINMFCGTIVNAARDIAMQVNTAVTKFSGGFLTALRPQIIKAYSSGDISYLIDLTNKGTRFASFLLVLISLPIILECHYILYLWLGNVPEYTTAFVKLIIVLSICEGTLIYAHNTALMATGKIKYCQLITGIIQLMNIPISYYYLYVGFSPISTVIIAIIIANICCFIRVIFLKRLLNYSISIFVKTVYLRILLVAMVAYILPFYIQSYMAESFIRLVIITSISLIWSALTIILLGCTKVERCILYKKIISKVLNK